MRKLKQFFCGLKGHDFESCAFPLEDDGNVIDMNDYIIAEVCTKCEKVDPESVMKI